MDVLTDVLETTQVRGVVLSNRRYVSPWGFQFGVKQAGFHLVMDGLCWLRVGERPAQQLLQGDLVLVPSGASHALSDTPTRRLEPLEALQSRTPQRASLGAQSARVVCGAYQFDGPGPNPLLALLPPVLHLSAAQVQAYEPLSATLRMLMAELEGGGPGSDALVDRLVNALLVYLLRSWLRSQPEGTGGWLGALTDGPVGRALARVHSEPARGWTVETLAREAGLSRAAFARRFQARVGMPPLGYLTRWRMDLAAQRLRGSTDKLAQIASDVGYDSEFAFSRAFKRTHGVPPSALRAGRPAKR